MLKSISIAAGALALCTAGAIVVMLPSQRATAQSAGLFVNAVDLDIVPTEREKFLSSISLATRTISSSMKSTKTRPP